MKQKMIQVALTEFLTPELAEKVNKHVIDRKMQIDVERTRYTHRALEKHFVNNILPGIALYLVLQEETSITEDALELTRKILNKLFDGDRKRMVFVGRLPFLYWLAQKMIPWIMKHDYPSAGWQTEWLEVSKKQVAFNIHSCFYLDTLRHYGVPELTPVFCGLDDLVYGEASKYVRWQRQNTLGRGETLCDFRFINPRASMKS